MNKEFDFIDLYYLNDICTNNNTFTENFIEDKVIEISELDNSKNAFSCTYAKFMEILDTRGLEGLINA